MLNRPKKQCYFCVNNIEDVDYKDAELLSKFMSEAGDIFSARNRGTCRRHQKKLIVAIEKARFMALLPFTTI